MSFLRSFYSGLLAVCLLTIVSPAARADTDDPFAGVRGCADGKARSLAARAALSKDAASEASQNLDVTYYDLDITINFTAEWVGGIVRIEGRALSAMSTLSLDLAVNMTVTAVGEPGGGSLAFTHPGDRLDITLSRTYNAGEMVAVEVTYGGSPASTGFGAFVFGDLPYAWSLSEPYGAREWWPCKDHPSDKADSVRVAITVPDGIGAGSQGLLRSVTSNGGVTTYEWVSHYPITSYLISVATGPYVEYTGTYTRPAALAAQFGPLDLPLVHLRFDDGTSDLPEAWANVDDAFCVLEDWFGPYPFPAEKYGHAEFTFSGGMEHQTMASMGASSTSLVVHELAHQWFGDAISPRTWPHLWLNEGFATHAEHLYWKAREDSFPGTYEIVLRARRNNARQYEGRLLLADTSSVRAMFDPRGVYSKGSMVLQMLHFVVGNDAWKQILRAYASDPAVRYGNATTADLQRVAESIHGASLDTFFKQWVLEGTGYPIYSMRMSSEEVPGGYRAYVTVQQNQTLTTSNVDVFEMPLELAVLTDAGEERFVVFNDRRFQTFGLDVSAKPTGVFLDPDGWLLRDENVAASAGNLPSLAVFQTITPNPAKQLAELGFTLPGDGEAQFQIFDVRGRAVAQFRTGRLGTGPNRFPLNTSRLAAGIYFVRLETPWGGNTRKLVVVR